MTDMTIDDGGLIGGTIFPNAGRTMLRPHYMGGHMELVGPSTSLHFLHALHPTESSCAKVQLTVS